MQSRTRPRESQRWAQGLWPRLRCGWSHAHEPVHQPLGGFRCSRCGKCGANLAELGFDDEGYVSEAERRRLAQSSQGNDQAA